MCEKVINEQDLQAADCPPKIATDSLCAYQYQLGQLTATGLRLYALPYIASRQAPSVLH
jgi:hypothetical protein